MKLTKEFKRENLLRHSFLALALCSTLGVFSQTRNVNGRVVDQNGGAYYWCKCCSKRYKIRCSY